MSNFCSILQNLSIILRLPGWNDARTFASDRIYTCVRQFTMNLRYAFNNCAFARVRTYVLSTQLGVLRDQVRVLSVRKCADFHENRLIYAYLSTRVPDDYIKF